MEPPVNFTADEVRNEKVKVLQAIHAPTPRSRSTRSPCARSTPRASRAASTSAATSRRSGVPSDSQHRDLRRPAPGGRQLALGRRAVLPAHRQAAGAQGHRDRGDAQAGAAPRPSSRRARWACGPTSSILTMQPNEGVSLSLGAKIPGTRMRIRPVYMEFLYGTSFLSQSPEAYERLIMDAMRGDATLFTRNDEVEAQWRICDPIVAGVGGDARAAAAVRGGLAGAGRGAALMLARPGVAHDLMPGVSDSRWAAEGTTPGAIEAALREMLKERHAENESFSPARALNMVCVVDKAWSGEIANRLRHVGRYHASRTIVLAVEPRRDQHRRGGDDRQRRAPQGGRVRAPARDGDRRRRREAHARAGHDRRPARRHRPADRAVVAARPPRGGRRPAAPRAGRAARLDRRPRPPRRRSSARASCWTRPTSSTSRGCARRRGASAWRRRSTRRTCAPTCGTSARSRVRHHPESAAAALLLIGWLASRLGWQPSKLIRATARCRARPTASARTSSCASSPSRARACAGWPG